MNVKHGLSGTPVHKIWITMRQRCLNPKASGFHLYGGRGVRVCERWSDFECFVSDVGPRPSPAHTLERQDNSRGYEPGNCVWATPAEQALNRRSNVWVTLNGERKCFNHAAQALGMVNAAVLRKWASKHGATPQQAVDHYAAMRLGLAA